MHNEYNRAMTRLGEPSDPDIYRVQPCSLYIRIYVGEVYLGGGHIPDANEVKVKV